MPDEPNTQPIEPEVVNEQALAKPGTAISADDLALLEEGRGEKIILQRAQILATARAASIKATFENDWTLFKTPEGYIYGYLEDQGCQRIKRIWGIQLSNYGPLLRDPFYEWRRGEDQEIYSCRLTGDGYSDLTKERFDHLEGFGYSTNQDAQQAPPEKREDIVSNHARRNLEGKLTRRAGGLEAVPVEEIQRCWEGTGRRWEKCPKGKGFGTADERVGGASDKHGIDPADIPMCDVCRIKLVYRPAKKFFGCPTYAKHPDTKVIVNLDDLVKQLEARKQKREPGAEG